MEEISELIRQYGLEEDEEHIIIPLTQYNGKKRKCYILKRRFIRIVYPEGKYIDYPISKAVEATIKYPELSLGSALHLLYQELDMELPQRLEVDEGENNIE